MSGESMSVLARVLHKALRSLHYYSKHQRMHRKWHREMSLAMQKAVSERWKRCPLGFTVVTERRNTLGRLSQQIFNKGDLVILNKLSLLTKRFQGEPMPDRNILVKMVGTVLSFKNHSIKLLRHPWVVMKAWWREAERRFDAWLDA